MDALIGADEDDDIVEGLLNVDSSRKNSAVAELEFDSIVEQVGVQRLLHQLHRVTCSGPACSHSVNTQTHNGEEPLVNSMMLYSDTVDGTVVVGPPVKLTKKGRTI